MTEPSRRILFMVPFGARDLEGLALVAYHLERRYGHETLLTNAEGVEQKLLRHAPDAVVFDHLSWDLKAKQVRLAKSLGMKVLVLPTEGFFHNSEDPRRRAGKLQGVSRLVDFQFTWGTFARSAILEEDLAAPERVQTIGCPRFDFYHEPYLTLMGSREEFLASLGIERRSGPIVLWATNTTYLAQSQRRVLRQHITRGGFPEAEVRSMLEDEQVQYREHSRIVIELARQHPDWNIVIKVHPAEYIDPYFAVQRQAANIRVAFNAPIFKFLYHCDVLLQRGCTTATEAWILGKPVLEMEVGRHSAAIRADFVAGNEVVGSLEEADATIRRYLAGAEIRVDQLRAREQILHTFYDVLDGRASERCAEGIQRLVSPPRYSDADRAATQEAARRVYGAWRRREDERWANRLKDLVGIRRDTSLRFFNRFLPRGERGNRGMFVASPEISTEMVDALWARYDRVLANTAEEAPSGCAGSPPALLM